MEEKSEHFKFGTNQPKPKFGIQKNKLRGHKTLGTSVNLFKNCLNRRFLFLGLVYRDSLLIVLYLVVIGTSIKNQINRIIISHKKLSKKVNKWTYGHSDNEFIVATLYKSYLSIIIFEIDRTIQTCLT